MDSDWLMIGSSTAARPTCYVYFHVSCGDEEWHEDKIIFPWLNLVVLRLRRDGQHKKNNVSWLKQNDTGSVTPARGWEQVIYITKALYRGHLDWIGLGETVLFYIFVEDIVWTQFCYRCVWL